MRSLIVFFLIIATTTATFDLIREWEDYKRTYGKNYNAVDNVYRKSIYLMNRNQIRLHNMRYDRKLVTYQLGVNQFTDRTYAEYARIFETNSGLIPGGNALPPLGQQQNQNQNTPPWENYDWRNFGAVTPVRDQGIQCNVGWAFASLSTLESRTFFARASLPPPLSPQNLIDCIQPSSCNNSKSPMDAYRYIEENQNVNTESRYPYQSKPNVCRYISTDIGATCADYRNQSASEIEIQNIIKNSGPAVIQFDPLSFSFMHYKSGAYRPNPNRRPSTGIHFLSIIGYGYDPNTGNYWIAKNSFGSSWGEEGYIRIASDQLNTIKSISYPLV